MRLSGIWLLALGAVLTAAAPTQAASFTITDWLLSTGVVGAPGSDWDHSTVVQNNFQESHYASAGNSTAASTFDFAWNDTFGRFLIEGAHQAEDVRASVDSRGLMYFETTVDVLFDIDIAYTYNLPGGQMSGGFTYNLLDIATHENFAGSSHHADTWTAGPVSGTLAIQASGLLPAGREYAFTYKMELDTSSNTGLLATGSGHVDLTLTAVPEPTSLAPLGLLLLVARRRRGGWRCAVR